MQEQQPEDARTEALDSAQTIRSMIAHSDERFQALSMRIAGLEDNLIAIVAATRALRTTIEGGGIRATADGTTETGDAATYPAPPAVVQDVEDIRATLEQLERHLAAAFDHLANRDQEMIASFHEQVRAETSLTLERVETLEGHVRDGALAMGNLVGAVQEEVRTLSQIAAQETDSDPVAIQATIDDRMARLAALVRSDSTRLAELVQEAKADGSRAMAETLDARLGRMSELVSATTMSAVSEVARKVPEETVNAIRRPIEELTMSMDSDFVSLTDTIDAQLRRIGNSVAEQTAQAADAAIAHRLNSTLEKITAAAAALDRPAATGGITEATGEDIADLFDQRITALAKLIRADNKALASVIEVAAEQQAAKQAARAVKEMHASLPDQMMEAIDRRFQALADAMHRETQATVEAFAKTADVLAQRLDDATTGMNDRHERDMQGVNEQLGDAVRALINIRRQ